MKYTYVRRFFNVAVDVIGCFPPLFSSLTQVRQDVASANKESRVLRESKQEAEKALIDLDKEKNQVETSWLNIKLGSEIFNRRS